MILICNSSELTGQVNPSWRTSEGGLRGLVVIELGIVATSTIPSARVTGGVGLEFPNDKIEVIAGADKDDGASCIPVLMMV